MKKLVVFLLLNVCAFTAGATDIGDDFYRHFNAGSNLGAYNKDINALVGVSDFHTGSSPVFPGFALGATMNAVKVSNSNNISSDSYLYTALLQAQTRIPVLGLGVAVRGTDFNGLSVIGGGLTYQWDLLETFHVSVGGFYDHLRTDWYSVNHYSATATVSTSLLIFTPYIGAGYDYGKLATHGFANNRSTDNGAGRYTVGVNVKILPLIYAFGAYTHTSGRGSFQGGVGFSL